MYNTQHMSETPKKRGRKKGSTSFTKIRLKDLSDRLRDVGMTNQATIVVSKRWLEDVIEAQEALKRQKAALAATDLLMKNASFTAFADEIKEAQNKGRSEEWREAFARKF